jgi:chemotaxis protein CheX
MRYEYIEPFIGSTMQILDNVLDSKIIRGDVSLINSSRMRGEVSIVINVVGDSNGTIVVSMDTLTALNVYNAMTGENSNSLTELGIDAISELTNMIAGNAISVINDLGYQLTVSPPFIFRENSDRDEVLKALTEEDGTVEVIHMPFFTDCGAIDINLAMLKER